MEEPEPSAELKRNVRLSSSGYIFVISAAMLWAASGTAAKFLFRGGISAFQLVQLRTTIASAILFAWLIIRKPKLLRIEINDLVYFILLGIALAASQVTYLYAISKIHVAAAILLQYLSPVFIALYVLLFSRGRLALTSIVATAGAVAGSYLMVGGYRMDVVSMSGPGIVSGLISAVAFAAYTVKSEYGMHKYTPWTVVFYAMAFAAIFWNIFHPPLSAFAQPRGIMQWLCIFFVGTFGTILSFGFYNKGIKLVGAMHANISATLEPVFAGVVAYFVLGETMAVWQAMGGLLVIASVLLIQLTQKRN